MSMQQRHHTQAVWACRIHAHAALWPHLYAQALLLRLRLCLLQQQGVALSSGKTCACHSVAPLNLKEYSKCERWSDYAQGILQSGNESCWLVWTLSSPCNDALRCMTQQQTLQCVCMDNRVITCLPRELGT